MDLVKFKSNLDKSKELACSIIYEIHSSIKPEDEWTEFTFEDVENFNTLEPSYINNLAATLIVNLAYSQLNDIQSSTTNTTTPVINNLNYMNSYLLLWYAQQVNGCYMITNNKITRLNGCSNYYGDNILNQTFCSCGSIDNNLNCDSNDEYLHPYCIGTNDKSSSLSSKCETDDPKETILKCSTDNNVYYTYINDNVLSLYFNTQMLNDLFINARESNKPNNTIKNILIIGSIILVVALIIFLSVLYTKKIKKSKRRS